MRNVIQLAFTLVHALIILLRPGGTKALVAENICLRLQLIKLTKDRKRAPNLSNWERLLLGLCASCIHPKRLGRLAILLKPETMLKFHRALVRKKYSNIFRRKALNKPGPKGPSQELINLVLAIKSKNCGFGYLRIAMQISNQFGIEINKDAVRHILNKYHKGNPNDNNGPSWLTFLGHTKDSLWSVDLFRAESIHLRSYWVMVIIDQYTRRIIGFKVHRGNISGIDLCWMFNKIISGLQLPKRLSSDNDPLFRYHKWAANLRVLEIKEIKTVPYTPISHPFVERLIGTIRQEYLNHILFWSANDLQNKLDLYQTYYNETRAHSSIDCMTPRNRCGDSGNNVDIKNFRWKQHLRGLVQLPLAA